MFKEKKRNILEICSLKLYLGFYLISNGPSLSFLKGFAHFSPSPFFLSERQKHRITPHSLERSGKDQEESLDQQRAP